MRSETLIIHSSVTVIEKQETEPLFYGKEYNSQMMMRKMTIYHSN